MTCSDWLCTIEKKGERRRGDGETGRRGDGETGRRGDGEQGRPGMGRHGDTETGRRENTETGRRGDTETGRYGVTEIAESPVSLLPSPHLPSPPLPSPSLRLVLRLELEFRKRSQRVLRASYRTRKKNKYLPGVLIIYAIAFPNCEKMNCASWPRWAH